MSLSRLDASAFTFPAAATVDEAARPTKTNAIEASKQIVIATIAPLVGNTGVQTHARAMRDGLLAAGESCIIQTPFNARSWWLPIFGVRRIFGPLNRSWSTRWYRHWHASALRDAMKRLLRRQRVDALLAQCPVSADVALNLREEFGLRFPIVMACHFNYSEASEYREKGELDDEASFQQIIEFERRVLGRVDRVIYVSEWAKNIVERERGISVRASSVIWNGIAADAGGTSNLRRELKLADDDLLVINVGTLERRKNQIGLLDLFAKMAAERPDSHLVLVGDGPDRHAIQRRADALGLSTQIHLLGSRRDVPDLLKAADLYLHYSTMENCPLAIIEAARASLPLVAVPGGGVPELLAALGGFAIDAADHDASLKTIRPLLADASVRREIGRQSRAAFERSFTREAMVEAYLKAFEIKRDSEVPA